MLQQPESAIQQAFFIPGCQDKDLMILVHGYCEDKSLFTDRGPLDIRKHIFQSGRLADQAGV